MKLICLLLLSVFVGCTTTDEPTSLTGELAAFNWLQQADSGKDAEAAIAKQDYRLLAINLRGVVLPGIAPDQLAQVKQQCKYRFLDGMGDVLTSKEQRQWWKKGKAYAEAYNKIMVGHCFK
jgi:hypothetical protein